MSEIGFEFLEKLRGRGVQITRKINEATYNVMAEVIQRADEYSPVGMPETWKRKAPPDYEPGQFRGNWQLGVNERPQGYLPGHVDPDGHQTVAENLAKIPERAGYGNLYYLVNNVPYAQAVEQGDATTQVPPSGIIGRIHMEFPDIVEKVISDITNNGGRVR
jgi:hypothetical protein